MTNPDYTHITLVVDRSGSMGEVRDDAQGGIRSLLESQRALPGKLTVTLVEFDDEVNEVARMAEDAFDYTLEPRGMTALLDAVGTEIVKTGENLAALEHEQRPGKVVFVVVTDGRENASHEYDLERVRSMVEHQRDAYRWTFQFIGAGEHAWQGAEMGMKHSAFVNSKMGNRAVYASMNQSMSAYRAGIVADFSMPDLIPEQDAGDAPAKPAPKRKRAPKPKA